MYENLRFEYQWEGSTYRAWRTMDIPRDRELEFRAYEVGDGDNEAFIMVVFVMTDDNDSVYLEFYKETSAGEAPLSEEEQLAVVNWFFPNRILCQSEALSSEVGNLYRYLVVEGPGDSELPWRQQLVPDNPVVIER